MSAIHFSNRYGSTPHAWEAEIWVGTIMVTGSVADVTCKTCLAALANRQDPDFFDSTSCGRVYSTRIDFSPAPG